MKYIILLAAFLGALLVWMSDLPANEGEEPGEAHSPEIIAVEEPSSQASSQSLASQIEEKKQESAEKIGPEIRQTFAEGIQAVVDAGVLDNALEVGDKAPNFMLRNQLGEEVTLEQQLAQGPVILTWYRGGWCPYCNLTLRALQEWLPDFKSQGATLLALTPELPDKSMDTAEQAQLEFQVLSDVGNDVAERYGLVFDLTPEVAEIYQRFFDLKEYNGDDSNRLPLAASYIVDTDGVIRYAFVDADYTKRAEPQEIYQHLESFSL